MRIAIFSDNFYPELSGIADSVTTLAKELARRGHVIRFYVPRYSARDYEKAGLAAGEQDIGPNISFERFFSFPYPTGTGQGRMVIPTCLRWLSVKKFGPDLIHTQLFFGVGIEALVAARRLGVPLVGTNHTATREFLRYAPIRVKWLENAVLKYVNWYYEKCCVITGPSRSVKEEMEGLGFRGKFHVISNPLDTDIFRPLAGKNQLIKKFGFNDTTVIHAGRLAPERNVDVMIRAISLIKKNIPSIKLALAGQGSAEPELRKLAANLDVEENVKFLGVLDKKSLAEAYNAAKIFLITSTSDTQSMVMMQAMASGLPVIAVKARALPEYVNAKNGMLIGIGDVEALAQKTAALLKNRELRLRLGEGARRFANKFSAASITAEWEEIYAGAMEKYMHRHEE